MSAAKKPDEYQELAEQFSKISSYEDASKKADECEVLAESLIFDKLCEKMSDAKKPSDYEGLAGQFHELTTCKKAQSKVAECESLAKSLRYDELCGKMNSSHTLDEYLELEKQFRDFSIYKDAPQKALECRHLAEPLICFTPITQDGRLSAKDIIGNRTQLTKWQDDFFTYMVKAYPDLERGESASVTGRLTYQRGYSSRLYI